MERKIPYDEIEYEYVIAKLDRRIAKKLEEMASGTDCTVAELISLFIEERVKKNCIK